MRILKALLFTVFLLGGVQISFASCASPDANTRFWVGGGSSVNWNATVNTNWGTASNTQDNASVPGATEDVCFDGVGTGNSASTLSANITIHSLDMTGYANTFTHANSIVLTVNGSLFTLSSGMTYTTGGSASGLTFTAASGTVAITLNGKSPSRVFTFNGAATFQLQDSWVNSAGQTSTCTLTSGTLDINGKSLNCSSFIATGSVTRAIKAISGTLVLHGSGTIFSAAGATNLTVDFSNNGTLSITDVTVSNKTLAFPSGLTFGDVEIAAGGTGLVIFQGANTYNRIISVGAKNIQFPGSTTTTLTAAPILSLATITSSAASATLSLSSGTVCVDRSSLTNIVGTGGATWYAQNSTDGGGNTGWTFAACPPATGGQSASGSVF